MDNAQKINMKNLEKKITSKGILLGYGQNGNLASSLGFLMPYEQMHNYNITCLKP